MSYEYWRDTLDDMLKLIEVGEEKYISVRNQARVEAEKASKEVEAFAKEKGFYFPFSWSQIDEAAERLTKERLGLKRLARPKEYEGWSWKRRVLEAYRDYFTDLRYFKSNRKGLYRTFSYVPHTLNPFITSTTKDGKTYVTFPPSVEAIRLTIEAMYENPKE